MALAIGWSAWGVLDDCASLFTTYWGEGGGREGVGTSVDHGGGTNGSFDNAPMRCRR